jgi:hypothetical protein
MTVTKNYSTKAAAKKSLHKVFGVGPYSQNGLYSSARFCNGSVEEENGSYVIKLTSTYWSETSLNRAFSIGIDSI